MFSDDLLALAAQIDDAIDDIGNELLDAAGDVLLPSGPPAGFSTMRNVRVTRPGDVFQKMIKSKRGRHRVSSGSARLMKNDPSLYRF